MLFNAVNVFTEFEEVYVYKRFDIHKGSFDVQKLPASEGCPSELNMQCTQSSCLQGLQNEMFLISLSTLCLEPTHVLTELPRHNCVVACPLAWRIGCCGNN